MNKINQVGLHDLQPDVRMGTDEISIEHFMEFISDKLELDIPQAFQDPVAFNKFVQHRIVNFKEHPFDIDQ